MTLKVLSLIVLLVATGCSKSEPSAAASQENTPSTAPAPAASAGMPEAAPQQAPAKPVAATLPDVIAFVLSLGFVLLMLAFRSIALPLTAIAVNLMPVGAAYGLLVLVFQKGVGADLLVTGAFTHSRLIQIILGGVTRHLIASAHLPVLMDH